MNDQGKLLTKHNTRAYLGWALKSLTQISQYLFISIMCAKISCVTWALVSGSQRGYFFYSRSSAQIPKKPLRVFRRQKELKTLVYIRTWLDFNVMVLTINNQQLVRKTNTLFHGRPQRSARGPPLAGQNSMFFRVTWSKKMKRAESWKMKKAKFPWKKFVKITNFKFRIS